MFSTILPSEMKQLETRYMEEFGIPSILLMEHAAQGVLDALKRHAAENSTAVFLCGPGANGGDGYAAARMWQNCGGTSIVCELSSSASGDALVNRTLALQAGCSFVNISDAVHSSFFHASVIVDALFGTGLSRAIEGEAALLIHEASAYAAENHIPVIAVDIPSGLHGGTGKVLGCVLPARETVTFHRPKTGLYLSEGPNYTGRITVWPIDIPSSFGDVPGFLCMEKADLPLFIPPRPVTSHKGTFGRTVILAGSPGMAGAAAMCASAAVRAGSGLTTILCTESLLPVLQVLCPAAMCRVLPDFGQAGLDTAASLLSEASRAVIGCGISRNPQLVPFLELFRKASCPVIWDADALVLLADHPSLLPLPEKDIITPHPGEAARLLGVPVRDILEDPVPALRRLRDRAGCHVLLKGARTLMAADGISALNPLGTPALAKGGSGDILAGLLAALVGRTDKSDAHPTLTAMQCACLIHALAAQAAAEETGEDCVTPEDVIRRIRLRP